MTPAAAARLPPQRTWALAVAAILALVLLAIGYVQWWQYKLLDIASHQQSDALGWSFSQLETEQLRLRHQLGLHALDPKAADTEAVQLRYDIFVSRVGLLDQPRVASVMSGQPAYASALQQVRAFVQAADRYLGPAPERPFDARATAELMRLVEAMNAPLHDLSLGGSHLLYQRVAERTRALQQQSKLSIALTVFQCLLMLLLATIVMRQLRALTERRRALEALADNLGTARRDAEAASRAKSAFLANMSHEIRTPFHGMLGMMSLLQEGGLSPQQAVYLDTARESAHHLLTILNDILDISQLDSGRLSVVPQTVDLPQLVAQVEGLMRAQAHSKGLVLAVGMAPDVPRWVRADPTRLKQILFNLLSNALKFTASGQVSLDVSIGAVGSGPSGISTGTATGTETGIETVTTSAMPAGRPGTATSHIDFSVTDSGIGMDDATLARLFQRFMQGDASPSRRASGTGLGLEISRDLARLMGGDIAVRSRPGAGSTFTASLPLASASPPPVAADEAEAAEAAHPRAQRPLRVLVAEDHPVNRAYLEAVLEKLGHAAVFAVDGASAVRAIEDQPANAAFDIVLMDLHMPGMDGFTAARAVRAMPPPRGKVPIVALTADAFQASRQLALEAGMDGFLAKPAHLPQLRDALARYGGSSGPRSAAAADPAPPAPPAPAGPATAGAPPAAAAALLDLSTVADVREAISAARYADLLGGFIARRAGCVAELRQALQAAPRAELAARAHSLKGAALSLGLHQVGTLAGRLQTAANSALDDDPAELAALIESIAQRFEASLAECERHGLLVMPAQPPAAPLAPALTPPAAPAPA